MVRWIQERIWLSSSLLTLILFAVLASLDFDTLTPSGAVPYFQWMATLAFFASVFLAFHHRFWPLITLALAFGLAIIDGRLGFSLLAGLAAVAVVSLLQPIIFSRLLALLFLIGTVLSALFSSKSVLAISVEEQDSLWLAALSVVLAAALAHVGGLLIRVIDRHVGKPADRAMVAKDRARLNLALAEQEERFDIARDISDLIVQRITAVISQAEGALYASKVDPEVAPRALQRISASAADAQVELRRLYEMLNRTSGLSVAPPQIDELEDLVVSYRERGLNATLKHHGHTFRLSEGAQLVLYRIVFEALENVSQHAPVGTDVSVDFTWVDSGLQILIKDNGIEVQSKSLLPEDNDSSYSIKEDLASLTETVMGPGILGMRERAALYGGLVEVTKVPGVGFTVSAIFPNLKSMISIQGER